MLTQTTLKDYPYDCDFVFLAKALRRIMHGLRWHSYTTWRVL